MAKSKLTENFQKLSKDDDFLLVQAYIPADLRKKAADQIKIDRKNGFDVTWDKLIELCVRQYLEERGVK